MEIHSDYPINENVIKDIEAILNDYNLIVSKRIKINNDNENLTKEFLTDSTDKKCRFCNKSYPEVKFEKEAHAIPNFMGNDQLFSKYECDSCNEYFGRFENEMANFMLPNNTISGTKGKNGIPKYNQKGQPIIEIQKDKVLIKDVPNSFLDNLNEIELKIKLPTYIPDYIYRCLIKIGLSIIPESKLTEYSGTINWLMDKKIDSNSKPQMIFSMYSFNLQMDEIVCSILERKENCNRLLVNSILFISYKNFAFQTYIPYNSKEKLNIKLYPFQYIIPTTLDLNREIERNYHLIDLSSKEKKINDFITYNINHDGEIIVEKTKC